MCSNVDIGSRFCVRADNKILNLLLFLNNSNARVVACLVVGRTNNAGKATRSIDILCVRTKRRKENNLDFEERRRDKGRFLSNWHIIVVNGRLNLRNSDVERVVKHGKAKLNK